MPLPQAYLIYISKKVASGPNLFHSEMPVLTKEREKVECNGGRRVGCKPTSEGNSAPLFGRSYPFKSLIQCDLNRCTREQMKEYFTNSYDLDELVFSAIKDESSFFKCPDRLRLPLIFYLAHTASVYVNKLMLAGLIKERVNKDFEIMFETGVDEMSWDDTENYRMGGCFQWPSVREVLTYRLQVREAILQMLDSVPIQLPITQDSPLWSIFMGFEHERIHLETSSVLLRQLPVGMLKRPEGWKYGPLTLDTPAGPNEFVKVPEGVVEVGKPTDFPSYGWDNEYGRADMKVPEFSATKYLVSNREFLEFVKDNGYQRRELWTDEGWKWVEFRQARHPTFWVCGEGCKCGCGADLASYSHCDYSHSSPRQNGASNGDCIDTKFKYRAIYDVLEMPWEWPVDANYHEAKAFCTWKGPGYRLPTEAEHHRMRGDPPPSCEVDCDPAFKPDYPANINLKYGSSTPVHMFPPTSMGFHDVYGNMWEWTEDHFNGLPGFKTTYLYDDFSTPCFDGRHTMMMGGSWISTGAESSRFARFAFRRHFFQHLGFRLVDSNEVTPTRLCKAEVFVLGAGVSDNPVTTPRVKEEDCFHDSTNVQFQYETKEKLDSQLRMEYGNMEMNAVPLVQFLETTVAKYDGGKDNALVLGCGGGLTSLLLTKTFDKIVGVDYSGRFIDTALAIQAGKGVEFGEGQVACLSPSNGVDATRVTFKQMTWVPNELEDYNLIAIEFLHRLSEPKGWLIKLWECLVPGGLVVITSKGKWDRTLLQTYIGKWFSFLEESKVSERNVTVWRLK